MNPASAASRMQVDDDPEGAADAVRQGFGTRRRRSAADGRVKIQAVAIRLSHVPADLGALLAEPGADDRPGGDVRGGQRVAEARRTAG